MTSDHLLNDDINFYIGTRVSVLQNSRLGDSPRARQMALDCADKALECIGSYWHDFNNAQSELCKL